MTVLAPKSARDALNIDCIERAIVYSTLLLRYANDTLGDDLPQQFANAVRLTTAIKTQDGQPLSFFEAEISLPFESGLSLKTAWAVAKNVSEFSDFNPNPFGETSEPYDFGANPVAEMPEDPDWVTTVERYLAWCCCLLRANTVLNSNFVQIAILEDSPNYPTFSIKISLPFAYSRYFLSNNLIESLIGVTANLNGSPISTPINPILSAAEEIRDLLETLEDEDRLDAAAIKNLPVGGGEGGGALTASQVRDLLASLTGSNRLSATAIRDIPEVTGTQVRDLLAALTGSNRLSATAIRDIPEVTGTQVRNLLAALTGNDRLDAAAIKNLPSGQGGTVEESRLVPPGGTVGQVVKKGPDNTVVWGEDLQGQGNNANSLTVINSNTTALSNFCHLCDTSMASFVLTLPLNAINGDVVEIADASNTSSLTGFGINPLTIAANTGQNIVGDTNLILNKGGQAVKLIFYQNRWTIIGGIGE